MNESVEKINLDNQKGIVLSIVDGSPSAESTKVYNILTIKQGRLVELLLQYGLVFTIGETVSLIIQNKILEISTRNYLMKI